MRWDALFEDMAAQLEAAEASELAGDVADRTRRELASLRLADRLRAHQGRQLVVRAGPVALQGRLVDSGPDWLLLEEPGARQALVPLAAVTSVGGLSRDTAAPHSEGMVARGLDLRWALRGLARSRAVVVIDGAAGPLLSGALDRVGADYLEVAPHLPGEARRAGSGGAVLVPLSAVCVLRSG